MTTSFNIFFTTQISNNHCFLESTGDFFFAPIRTLFGEKKVVHVDGHYLVIPSRQQSTFTKIVNIATAIFCLIPGFFLGVCFKGLAMLRSSVRKSHSNFKELFNKKTADQNFITDKNGTYLLLGDRATFKPSIESYQNRYPWSFLDKSIKSPTALHLQNMKVEHVERVLKLKEIKRNAVKSVDLRGVSLTLELLDLLIEKCPNIENFIFTDLSKVPRSAVEKFLSQCTKLDDISKDNLEKVLKPANDDAIA